MNGNVQMPAQLLPSALKSGDQIVVATMEKRGNQAPFPQMVAVYTVHETNTLYIRATHTVRGLDLGPGVRLDLAELRANIDKGLMLFVAADFWRWTKALKSTRSAKPKAETAAESVPE